MTTLNFVFPFLRIVRLCGKLLEIFMPAKNVLLGGGGGEIKICIYFINIGVICCINFC
jgi:hypothetical protein